MIRIESKNPRRVIDARKLHRTIFPKKILFPSNVEIGSILKKAKYMFSCAKV